MGALDNVWAIKCSHTTCCDQHWRWRNQLSLLHSELFRHNLASQTSKVVQWPYLIYRVLDLSLLRSTISVYYVWQLLGFCLELRNFNSILSLKKSTFLSEVFQLLFSVLQSRQTFPICAFISILNLNLRILKFKQLRFLKINSRDNYLFWFLLNYLFLFLVECFLCKILSIKLFLLFFWFIGVTQVIFERIKVSCFLCDSDFVGSWFPVYAFFLHIWIKVHFNYYTE